MENTLIVDVGMHLGQDTEYYLRKGYRVIGIDADVNLIHLAKNKYEWYLKNNMFTALNYAISDRESNEVFFNISRVSIWNSLKPEISNRHNMFKEKMPVQARTLPSIFLEYGVPYYCKIDIEGYDNICLNTLLTLSELPEFISVESECVGEGESLTNEEALQTLNTLHRLGYKYFKLIDQASLAVLHYRDKFYYDETRFFDRLIIKRRQISREKNFIKKFGYTFPSGSSGPFGEELAGEWMDYEKAKRMLIRHRQDYFKLPKARSYGFWCDWHATF